jgi:Mg-chelatase subunit ChlI
MTVTFPFSAVAGLEEAKLGLVLTALDPSVGGVLLRGQKGSAKSTLARGLAALLPGSAPFVELPVGATEDRVVGTLDLGAALVEGSVRFSPGLLAAADGASCTSTRSTFCQIIWSTCCSTSPPAGSTVLSARGSRTATCPASS